jgi:AcrR family transcriptional regulator
MGKNTQQLILETCKHMLERMSADKITVTALIRECGIGRNTFYYYYHDICELLDETIRSIFASCEDAAEGGTWQDTVMAILYACRKNRAAVYHIYYSLSRERLGAYINGRVMDVIAAHVGARAAERGTEPQRAAVISEMLSFAAIGQIVRFLWHDMTDDVEAISAKLTGYYDELLDRML